MALDGAVSRDERDDGASECTTLAFADCIDRTSSAIACRYVLGMIHIQDNDQATSNVLYWTSEAYPACDASLRLFDVIQPFAFLNF